jgi:hypothetical protein
MLASTSGPTCLSVCHHARLSARESGPSCLSIWLQVHPAHLVQCHAGHQNGPPRKWRRIREVNRDDLRRRSTKVEVAQAGDGPVRQHHERECDVQHQVKLGRLLTHEGPNILTCFLKERILSYFYPISKASEVFRS